MSSKPIEKGQEITGAITKHLDRRFLSSVDLIGMGTVTVEIDRVEKHVKLQYLNGTSQENAILMYFKGTDKPLSLCTTNIKAIIYALDTAKVDDWKGKKIKIEVQNVKAFGKIQPAVRVVGKG